MPACRQSAISGSLLLSSPPSPPLFPSWGDKDSSDLNHKLTIKNVQLTPRSIEDRWNRLESARPRTLSSAVFSPQRSARREKRSGLGSGKGRKLARSWKQSRRFNPARLRSLPGNLGPHPSLSFRPFSFAPSTTPRPPFPLYYNRERQTRKCAEAKGALFFSFEKSRARRFYMSYARTNTRICK